MLFLFSNIYNCSYGSGGGGGGGTYLQSHCIYYLLLYTDLGNQGYFEGISVFNVALVYNW